MILGIGNDVVGVERIRASYQRHGQRLLDRVYHANEQAYCLAFHDPAERLAARWAAKEAVLKALGSGLVGAARMSEIEVIHDERGAPNVRFHGVVAEQVAAAGPCRWHLSLSHAAGVAMATAIREAEA